MNIRIYPSFWIVSLLFGYLMSESIFYALLFVTVAFVSVLVHEMGHALMAKAYGLQPRVELYALGGLTIAPTNKMSMLQEFTFVLMGPLFGAFLAGFFGVLNIYWDNPPYLASLLVPLFYNLNVLWTLLNILPVHPLDGGRLVSIFLSWVWGEPGLRFSYLLSAGFAMLFAGLFFAFWHGLEVIGALFMLFAFDSFRAFRQTKRHSGQLTDEQEESIAFQRLHQQAAFEQGRYAEVLEMGEKIFVEEPDGNVALLNARAAARLGKGELAQNWLKSASRLVKVNMSEILASDDFTAPKK